MQYEYSVQDYVDVVKQGMGKKFNGSKPKKVVIVGAGLAGLSAAYELLKAGHDPLILEAQHRVGGRIYTMREPFAQGLYGEAGAMRIPRAHELTMAYIEKFGLQTTDFVMGNPQAYVYVGGVKRRMVEVQSGPELMGFEMSAKEKGKISGVLGRDDSSSDLESGKRRLGRGHRKVRSILRARISRTQRLVRGHDRNVRLAEQPGIGDELVFS